MFDEYAQAVLQDYREKRTANHLSLNLTHPTPSKLKAECLQCYEQRYRRSDDKVISSFFGTHDDAETYRLAMKKFDLERFKPLINFLKAHISKTDEKNVELLAWLIDFEPRPYQMNYNYQSRENEGVSVSPPAPKTDKSPENTQINQHVHRKQPTATTKILVSLTLLIAAVAGAYLFIDHQTKVPQQTLTKSAGPEKCMYWAGDRYLPVSCNQKLGDTTVLALDSDKVAHFQRITRPDTLTQNSVRKVFYAKINGQVEFYTAAGLHPQYPERRLLPMTEYIFDKYVRHK